MPGYHNDINLLQRSPLFAMSTAGQAHPCNYAINGHEYNLGYCVVDDIYPPWVTSIKAISESNETVHRNAALNNLALFASLTDGANKSEILRTSPSLSAIRLAEQTHSRGRSYANEPNLKPALNICYCVSLAHGAIYIMYMIIESASDEDLVEIVSQQYGLSHEVLEAYLHKTKQICVKNPTSSESWNLITYGASLLDPQLPEDYASGGRVLTMLLAQDISVPIPRLLIRSPRQIIQRLIGTLAWKSPDEREMRWLAARIVENLAGHLKLAQIPGALDCVSSLFDTSHHNNGDQEALHLPDVNGPSKPKRRISLVFHVVGYAKMNSCINILTFIWFMVRICLVLFSHYISDAAPEHSGTPEKHNSQRGNNEGTDEDLLLPGLRILANLAHDTQNCTLIYNSKGLLSKIIAPISSNNLVEDIKSNAAWTKIVDGSLKVVSCLMGSSGSTGVKMRKLIANNSNAIDNLEAVLYMDIKKNSGIIVLQMRALDILTQLALHHLDPASTSATNRREKLIQRALHIFLTAGWMEDYLGDEEEEYQTRMKDQTTSQQSTPPRPSRETCLDHFVTKAQLALAKMMNKRATEARGGKWMEEAKQIADRLKEKAEAVKSFTGCKDEDINRLTELLDSNIKTDSCTIKSNTMEIEIDIGCRISAAVILKHLRNHNMEPTLQKVLLELLPVQQEQENVNLTPRWWGRLLPNCCQNKLEAQNDGGQDDSSASQRHHLQQCGKRRLQAELLSLVAAILANNNFDFAAILNSPPLLKDFVVRLKKMVEDNMNATPACLAIQKLTCDMVIGFLQHDGNVKLIENQNIIDTLLEASKVMDRLESSMLFAGVLHDCHGVPLKPFLSVLANQAKDLLKLKKQAQAQAQAQGINSGPAGVSPT
ncbi:hypothetical protein VPH35_041052 [Triticum aestivum]|uniref:Uncharacterized protein n=1 Tax=Aegilops tauschii TaxID=37682 RepID=N1QWX8_AEGTA